MNDWQPIDTAPRDGRCVLLWPAEGALRGLRTGEPVPLGARWDEERWDVPVCDAWLTDSHFTHWMASPTAPDPSQRS